MSIETSTANNTPTKTRDERLDEAIERLISASEINAEASRAAKKNPSVENLDAWSKALAAMQSAGLAVAKLQTRKAA